MKLTMLIADSGSTETGNEICSDDDMRELRTNDANSTQALVCLERNIYRFRVASR